MEILSTLLVFAIVGGLARAVIILSQKLKNRDLVLFKSIQSPESYSPIFRKISLISQGIWGFCAILITNEFESSLLNLETLVILICLSFPIITFHLIKWLHSQNAWPFWLVLIGSCIQLLAFIPLNSVTYSNNHEANIVMMVIVFNIFYLCEHGVFVWNKFCSFYAKREAIIKKTILLGASTCFLMMVGYSIWVDHVQKPTSSSQLTAKDVALFLSNQ